MLHMNSNTSSNINLNKISSTKEEKTGNWNEQSKKRIFHITGKSYDNGAGRTTSKRIILYFNNY
jgi:hypothetical protein